MFKIKGIIKIDDREEDIENNFYVNNDWCIEHQHIIEHIENQRSFG